MAKQQQIMTLANIIAHGHMETRHKVRLWMDILRAIAEKHRAAVCSGPSTRSRS